MRAPSWNSRCRSAALRQTFAISPSTICIVKVAVNTWTIPRQGTPKNLSCSQWLVARTTTLSPSTRTSSTVHRCRTPPMWSNSTRRPSRPAGRSGGPPSIVHVGLISAAIAPVETKIAPEAIRAAVAARLGVAAQVEAPADSAARAAARW